MPTLSQNTPKFHIRFHAPQPALQLQGNTGILHIPVPILAGRQHMDGCPMPGAQLTHQNPLLLLETPQDLVGSIVIPLPTSGRLEEPTRQAYHLLLKTCIDRHMHLHRVWNYVPHINAINEGLEHYRQFNIGRWLAFENLFGHNLRSFMPAASAVGINSNAVMLTFIAGKTQPQYLENPSQIPAYHYPSEYGPRPPSFARAVLIQHTQNHQPHLQGYLSGTASIEGHQTIGENDWLLQLHTTMRNIKIMLERMGMQQILHSPQAAQQANITLQDLRCYLRHPEMLPLIQDWFQEETPWLSPHITYQQADICRAELDLEIEAMLSKRI